MPQMSVLDLFFVLFWFGCFSFFPYALFWIKTTTLEDVRLTFLFFLRTSHPKAKEAVIPIFFSSQLFYKVTQHWRLSMCYFWCIFFSTSFRWWDLKNHSYMKLEMIYILFQIYCWMTMTLPVSELSFEHLNSRELPRFLSSLSCALKHLVCPASTSAWSWMKYAGSTRESVLPTSKLLRTLTLERELQKQIAMFWEEEEIGWDGQTFTEKK